MGLIWDLIQHSQISESRQRADQAHSRAESVEQRLDMLELEVRRTNEALVGLLKALERRFGEDLDRDGRVG